MSNGVPPWVACGARRIESNFKGDVIKLKLVGLLVGLVLTGCSGSGQPAASATTKPPVSADCAIYARVAALVEDGKTLHLALTAQDTNLVASAEQKLSGESLALQGQVGSGTDFAERLSNVVLQLYSGAQYVHLGAVEEGVGALTAAEAGLLLAKAALEKAGTIC